LRFVGSGSRKRPPLDPLYPTAALFVRRPCSTDRRSIRGIPHRHHGRGQTIWSYPATEIPISRGLLITLVTDLIQQSSGLKDRGDTLSTCGADRNQGPDGSASPALRLLLRELFGRLGEDAPAGGREGVAGRQ
jgi:hypothetical protein